MTHITSISNPKVKMLLSLDKPKVRKSLGVSLVEGVKELEMASSAGVEFDSIYYVPEIANEIFLKELTANFPDLMAYSLSRDVFSKLSYRESTGGVLALVKTKLLKPKDLNLNTSPLILVIDGVEKPGNLGAMLRTADASAIDAVICCDLPGDLYNPNIIRASLGTIFTVPIAVCTGEEARTWLKSKHVQVFCSNLHQASDYFNEDYTGPSALVVGTEATGASQEWIEFADKNVKVPMLGKIDSMNVSVAAAIMIYEARRQRLANKS
ncbi:MAG: RNA methyltransferase [Bacteroidia bacterium]|nr:RNA methyltransferase [Bacteroidia bacterium]